MKQWYKDNDIDYDGNPLDLSIEFTIEDYYESMKEDFKTLINLIEEYDSSVIPFDPVMDIVNIFKDKYFK
jgi:hypothetical protein